VAIVNGDSQISLRLLDWFVTRHSNRNKILIDISSTLIDVHISYKAQLKSYKKKYFDPFKRRTKFNYHFKTTDDTIQTTIGQLNFFKWAIENNIINFIEANYDCISKDMNQSNKDDKHRKKEKATKHIISYDYSELNKSMIISFN
jgi:hypothetical protein